jgi:hypothetical protein
MFPEIVEPEPELEMPQEHVQLINTVCALCFGFPKSVVAMVAAALAASVLLGATSAERETVACMMRCVCLFEPKQDDEE